MNSVYLLQAAYLANIFILVPVVGSLLFTGKPIYVFGSAVNDSPALRLLVASLWGGILLCSIAGIWLPLTFMGILVLQIVYKLTWLLLYAIPAIRREDFSSWGPAMIFVPIIVFWPMILLHTWNAGLIQLR